MAILEGIPDILFKYRDFTNNHNRNTLFKFELFLSSMSSFNDPYEGSIPFTYEQSDLTPENIFIKMREMAIASNPLLNEAQIQEFCFKAQQKDLFHDETHIRQFNDETRDFISKNFGVLSLTSNPSNYLMWSHYANGHNGYCIGFDKCKMFEILGGGLGPVIYDINIPKLKLFGDLWDFYSKLLMTKSRVWEYENEYRLLKSLAANKVVPYPKEMIKQIYLGHRLGISNRLRIIDFVKENTIDCEVFQLSLDNECFKLNSNRVY